MIMASFLLKKQIMAICIMANFWKNSKLWQYALWQTFLKIPIYARPKAAALWEGRC